MNVDQKVFLGYGKVISDVYSIKHVDDLQDVANLPHYRDTNVYACKIEWVSKNSINFEYIKHIRNSHNNNQSINMCKEFNEVDDTAAQMLLKILDDPTKAPSPKTNPFTPVVTEGQAEGEANQQQPGGPPKPFGDGRWPYPSPSPQMNPWMWQHMFWPGGGQGRPMQAPMPGMMMPDPNSYYKGRDHHGGHGHGHAGDRSDRSEDSVDKRKRGKKYSRDRDRDRRDRSRDREKERETDRGGKHKSTRHNRSRSRRNSEKRNKRRKSRSSSSNRRNKNSSRAKDGKREKKDDGQKKRRRTASSQSSQEVQRSNSRREVPKGDYKDEEDLGKMFNDFGEEEIQRAESVNKSENGSASREKTEGSVDGSGVKRKNSEKLGKRKSKRSDRDRDRDRGSKSRDKGRKKESKKSRKESAHDGESDGSRDESAEGKQGGRKIDLRSMLNKPAKHNTIYERIKKR